MSRRRDDCQSVVTNLTQASTNSSVRDLTSTARGKRAARYPSLQNNLLRILGACLSLRFSVFIRSGNCDVHHSLRGNCMLYIHDLQGNDKWTFLVAATSP